jgi:hypothetical protein
MISAAFGDVDGGTENPDRCGTDGPIAGVLPQVPSPCVTLAESPMQFAAAALLDSLATRSTPAVLWLVRGFVHGEGMVEP